MKVLQYAQHQHLACGALITQANNGRQHRINTYTVDGFYKKCKVVVEAMGCYYHACNVCFKDKFFTEEKQSQRERRRAHDLEKKDIPAAAELHVSRGMGVPVS